MPAAVPGRSSCWNETDDDQFAGRFRSSTSSEYLVLITVLPKLAFPSGPSSLSCGMKSPLVSLHARVELEFDSSKGLFA